jgi:tetratricopeptide (TPR) repeat protein
LRELKEYDEAIRCFSKALESYDHAVNFDSNNTIRGFYKEKT